MIPDALSAVFSMRIVDRNPYMTAIFGYLFRIGERRGHRRRPKRSREFICVETTLWKSRLTRSRTADVKRSYIHDVRPRSGPRMVPPAARTSKSAQKHWKKKKVEHVININKSKGSLLREPPSQENCLETDARRVGHSSVLLYGLYVCLDVCGYA